MFPLKAFVLFAFGLFLLGCLTQPPAASASPAVTMQPSESPTGTMQPSASPAVTIKPLDGDVSVKWNKQYSHEAGVAYAYSLTMTPKAGESIPPEMPPTIQYVVLDKNLEYKGIQAWHILFSQYTPGFGDEESPGIEALQETWRDLGGNCLSVKIIKPFEKEMLCGNNSVEAWEDVVPIGTETVTVPLGTYETTVYRAKRTFEDGQIANATLYDSPSFRVPVKAVVSFDFPRFAGFGYVQEMLNYTEK